MRKRLSVMDRNDPLFGPDATSSPNATSSPDATSSNENARHERGPAAIATSILVMAAGAGFLAFTISAEPPAAQSTRPSAALSKLTKPALVFENPSIVADAPSSKPIASSVAPTIAIETSAAIQPEPIAFEDYTPRPKPLDFLSTEKNEDDFSPRIKPVPATAPTYTLAKVSVAPKAIILGDHHLASADDRPPSFFNPNDLEPRRIPHDTLAVTLSSDMNQDPMETLVQLKPGETFIDALKRADIGAADRNRAAYAFGKHYNLRGLLPGQEFHLTTSAPNQTLFQQAVDGRDTEAHLLALEFRSDAENRITIKRDREGGFEGEKTAVPLTTRMLTFTGRIEGSLYLSAKKAGAPDQVIAALANIFSYDVDFQRDIFGGDEFEAIFEARYDNAGNLVAIGDILYGRLKWRGRKKEKGYYLFASTEAGKKADYFDAVGQSAKRLLMKTPIDGARLSSGFGRRKHPVLGYAKAHKGVDFAAPRGTPIKAAGDGTIERAGPYGSFGNYIRIKHANGYSTAYAHMKALRKGMRKGKRVEQGQIIGYVGTTGRSTGPHLHYEVHKGGKAVNPQRLKIATGRKLTGSELAAFEAIRDQVDAMRIPPADDAQLLAKDDTSGSSL